MKQTVTISVVLIALVLFITRCAKNSSAPNKNLATCSTCNGITIQHLPDTSGLWFYLPTAFTPNKDGINDDFQLIYNSQVNVDSSTITIWDKNGNGVFEGTINQVWNGNDLKGNLCAAGHYPLYMKLRTQSGQTIDSCGCVTILTFQGACIYTGGVTYYFGDQVDTSTGFTLLTRDHLCP